MELWTKFFFVSLFMFTACEDSPSIEACEESPWTYENTGDPYMRTWCTSCHHSEMSGDNRVDGTEGINLNGFGNVSALLERIEARALGDTPTMPPSGGPTQIERDQLAEWIACGAPE